MRRSILPSLFFLPLLAGCFPADEPLALELAGRWAAPNAGRLRAVLTAERLELPLPTSAAISVAASCREQYVMFHKRRAITLYIDEQIKPPFLVNEVRRERARLILTGKTPLAAGWEWSQIEIVLRNGDIRFDDLVDKRGRSIR